MGRESTDDLKEILREYVRRAGYAESDKVNDGDMAFVKDVYVAGADYINQQCDSYLVALGAYHKYLQRAKGYTNSTATLAEIVLAASGAPVMAIGITAASFGFTNDVLAVTENTVLFALEPSAVQRLVRTQLTNYESNILTVIEPSSQAELIKALRGHVRICLPSSIKASVNDAVKAAIIDDTGQVKLTDSNGAADGT